MATLPHLHTPRLPLLGSRARARSNDGLPVSPRSAPAGSTTPEDPSVPLRAPATARPHLAASLVPVLLSLGGLFALALGAAYTGREAIGLVTRLFSGA